MLIKGDRVRQIMPQPVSGVVTGYAICQQTGDVQVKVEWTSGNDVHSRHFSANDLEKIAEIATSTDV